MDEDMDTEGADMQALIKTLAEPLLSEGSEQRHVEYSYQAVVNIAHENGLFDWLLEGKEVEAMESGYVERKDFILKGDSHSKFGKLMKRYAPAASELAGSRFRVFRFGKGDGSQIVRTSSKGRAGRRKYIIELPPKETV
jgi:hypothetical protein